MPFTNEEIIKKLVEIDAEFNKRWHDNTDDAGAAGCCKLLNSLIAFLKDKEIQKMMNQIMSSPDYWKHLYVLPIATNFQPTMP